MNHELLNLFGYLGILAIGWQARKVWEIWRKAHGASV